MAVEAVDKESFLRWMEGRYKPTTINYYRSLLEDVDEKRVSLDIERPLSGLTVDDLSRIQSLVESEGRKKWIVATSVLKSFYWFRGRDDLARLLTPRKYDVEVREPLWLEERVVNRIIESAPTNQDRAMLQVAYDLALRCSEVTLMDKAFINWKERTSVVLREKSHREMYSRSVLPISEKSLTLLRLYLNERGEDDEPALFVRKGGKESRGLHRIDSQSVQLALKRAMENAGVKPVKDGRKITFHAFARHSRLTHMAMERKDIIDIAKFAGHRRTDTTLMYIHLAGEALRKRMAR
jgi:integrase